MPTIVEATIYRVKSAKLHPIIVELRTDEDLTGVGEAAVSFGIGGPATAEMIREFCEQIVIGRDSQDINGLWSEMYDKSFWAKGGGPIVFGAMSAIEIALWDLQGKRLAAPIHTLLGGKLRTDISVYANGWNYEHLEAIGWARAAERPLKDGFSAIKCYPLAVPASGTKTLQHVQRREASRELLQLGRDRVKTLREVVGENVSIRLDICCALGPDDVIRFCDMVEEFDIDWLEEPAHPSDVAAHQRIANATHIPLATGERLYSRYDFKNVIESQSISIVQPDVGTAGGISEVRRIAAMADAHGLKFAPHNCASGISTSASLHLGASTSNFITLELFPYFRELPNYVEVLQSNPETRVKNGKLAVSSSPGLGVELDKNALKDFVWAVCTGDQG